MVARPGRPVTERESRVRAAEPVQGSLAGRFYLERGSQVLVLRSWGPGGGPRNVEIRRSDGTQVVRPFRGLRRFPEEWWPTWPVVP